MAKVKNTVPFHKEMEANKVVSNQGIDIEPDYKIEEDVVPENLKVDEKLRAGRFEEFPYGNNHGQKCKYRCCQEFDVTLQHMSRVVRDLNGRKIDGIFVNDLIGRYGFFDGKQKSRAQIAEKYKKTVAEIEFAHDKLKYVVQHSDYMAAYESYFEGTKKEVVKEMDQKQKDGE